MKRLLKFFFDFYIQSSIHVSLAVVSLYFVFVRVNEILINWYLAGFVFFASVTGYNFVKYASIAKLYHKRLTKALKSILVFSFFSFFMLLYFCFKLSLVLLPLIMVLGLLTFLYAIPLGSFGNFRSIAGLKIYFVAFCWVILVVFLPVLDSGFDFKIVYLYYALQFFLLVVSLIIPFDIRDLNYDDSALKTLPQNLGILRAKIVGLVLMFVFVGIEFLFLKSGNLGAVIFTFLITSLSIWLSPRPNISNFCSFWIEAIPILYFLLTILNF